MNPSHKAFALAASLAVAVVVWPAREASALPFPAAATEATGKPMAVHFRRYVYPRYVSPCRPGGRFYRYGGGWGCDYYIYGLWPARPPRRW